MNEQRGGDKADCYYHPKEVFVGVCPLCLHERLLVLSAKQGGHTKASTNLRVRPPPTIDHHNNNKPPIVLLPKFFALSSLFNRFESSRHHRKSHNYDDCSSTVSQDDSFISIQFENNGAGSWEKGKVVSKVSLDHCNMPWNNNSTHQSLSNKGANNNNSKGVKSVIVEHTKPRASSLRWRKRIGHLFHVMRWKSRSNKGSVCHMGSKKMEGGVKVRNGWIRTLTKRREPKNKGVY